MSTNGTFPRRLTVQRVALTPRQWSDGSEGPLQLRIQANWVRAAGFSEGDLVLIENPAPGELLIRFAGRRVEPPG